MSARSKGDEGELYVQSLLQRLYTGCNATSTPRLRGSGDLRLDMPSYTNEEDVQLLLEVKNWKDSVGKPEFRRFAQDFASRS